MPRVYVEFGQLIQSGNDCKSISLMIDGIKSAFQNTVSALDWDVQYMSDINNTAKQLTRKMDNCVQTLKSYQSFLYETHDKYAKLEGGSNSSGADGRIATGNAVAVDAIGYVVVGGSTSSVEQYLRGVARDLGMVVISEAIGLFTPPVIPFIINLAKGVSGPTVGYDVGIACISAAVCWIPGASMLVGVLGAVVGNIQINGKSVASWVSDGIATGVKAVGNAVASTATAAWNFAVDTTKTVVNAVADTAKAVGNAVASAATTAVNTVVNFFKKW